MREILFRGKAVGSLKWVEGFYFREAGNFIKELPSAVSTETHMVYEDTVGQYTGLTDKNGKKIFEGDILKGKHNWHNYNTRYGDDEKDFFEQKIRGAYGKHKSEEYALFEKDRYFYYRNYAVEYYAPHGGFRGRNGGQFYPLTRNFVLNRAAEIIGNIHDNPELLKGGGKGWKN